MWYKVSRYWTVCQQFLLRNSICITQDLCHTLGQQRKLILLLVPHEEQEMSAYRHRGIWNIWVLCLRRCLRGCISVPAASAPGAVAEESFVLKTNTPRFQTWGWQVFSTNNQCFLLMMQALFWLLLCLGNSCCPQMLLAMAGTFHHPNFPAKPSQRDLAGL